MSHNLGTRSWRILRALAEVVVPNLPEAPTDYDQLVRLTDEHVGFMPRVLKIAFPLGLLLLEFGTWLWAGTWRTFSRLDLARRRSYVEQWMHSSWVLKRDLIKGVKGIVMLYYYADPRVTALLGYHPEPYAKLVGAERLKRHGNDV